MEKGLVPHPIEIFVFFTFISIIILFGWQVVVADNGAIDQMTKYCNDKYGTDNWTLQNGYACHGVPFGGLNDCYECIEKVD